MELISQRPYYSHGPISGPFHTGAYIQTGGNVFKWLGHMARSVLFPYMKSTAKKVANSSTVKNLANAAKDAAVSGAIDASTKILKGHNVKDTLVSSGKKAGRKVKRGLDKEVNKIGKKLVEVTEPPPKKKKKSSPANLKASSKPSYASVKRKGRKPATRGRGRSMI